MTMEKPSFPVIESTNNNLKNEINTKLSELLEKGTRLTNVVELLDAQEFLEYIEPKKGQKTVAHFDVDGFIKKRISENRKFSLPEEYIKIDETILPPSEMEIKHGSGAGFKEAGIIPRSTLLMELLTEMDLKYSVIEGKNDPKMMRKLSYLIFDIPSIRKLVLVNDEERNATFIIHSAGKEEWKKYMKMTKEELSEMPYDMVSSINYPNKNTDGHEEKWKDRVRNLLSNSPCQPKETKEAEEIPDDWIVLSALLRQLNASWPVLQRYAEEYKTTHPEWVKNKGLKGATYISPELVDILKKKRIESAVPEGWLSPFALSGKLNLVLLSLQKQAEKYRQAHPEWFKFYTNIQGKEIEHYSPELVAVISKTNSDFNPAPENWTTPNLSSKKIGLSPETLKKNAEYYRSTYPEYFKFYKTERGVPREHFSPELAQILFNKYGNIESAPEGWLTAKMLAQLVGAGTLSIIKSAEKYRLDHPKWFKFYRNKTRTAEHFYPELVDIIKKEFEKDRAMPGWSGPYMLAEKIDVDGKIVKKYAEIYRTEYPEWFKTFKDKRGILREHYSPKLIAIIEKSIKKIPGSFEEAPTGWLTKSSAMKHAKLTWEAINKIADVYRLDHPEWFKMFKDKKGLPREHYSPELVEIIKNKFQKNKDVKSNN